MMDWVWQLIVSLWKWLTKLRPVGNLSATHITTEGNMERYRLSWTPSPSYHVDRHEVWIGLDGGATAKAYDCIASAVTQDISVPTGATVSVFVRTFADNGKQADSELLEFDATDETDVLPVSGLRVDWQEHQP
jgi:hypothetical protein